MTIGGHVSSWESAMKCAASIAASVSLNPCMGRTFIAINRSATGSEIFSGSVVTKAKGPLPSFTAISAPSNTHSQAAGEQRSSRGKSTIESVMS